MPPEVQIADETVVRTIKFAFTVVRAFSLLRGVARVASVMKSLQCMLGGMLKKKTVYVAETNGDGAVVCVWIDAHGQRSARPFNPRRNRFNEKAWAEFSGAKPDAIKRWIKQQQLYCESS